MSRKTLVFLDTETTGLDPRQHELLEVAMIVRGPHGGEFTEHFSLNINPRLADAKAMKVNRYESRRMDLAKIQVTDVVAGARFEVHLWNAVIIGNNPQFDLRFIEQFLLTRTMADSATPWHYHPVDLKALVAGRLGLGEPPWSTETIANEAGVPLPEGYHSALVDATWNRDVYDAVMNYDRRSET